MSILLNPKQITGSFVTTASAVGNIITFSKTNGSSFDVTITSTPINTGSFAVTGSNQFSGSQYITGSIFLSGSRNYIQLSNGSKVGDIENIDANFPDSSGSIDLYAPEGALWSQLNYGYRNYIYVNKNFASIYLSSGSDQPLIWAFNKNGTTNFPNYIFPSGSGSDGQALLDDGIGSLYWGNVSINTGSFLTTSSFNSYTGSNSSQFAGTASFAQTASYVKNAQTASYILQAVSASYATLAQTSNTASYILQATSSSFATTSSYSVSSSYALSSSYATTASFATSASYATSASFATSASYALTSSFTTNIAGGTDTYIPLWSGSNALTSSFLNQSSDILKTTSGSNGLGLNLNFINNSYVLGDYGGEKNFNLITVADNINLISLASDQNNNGSILNISGSLINTNYEGNDKGLKLDFAANSFTLGDPAGNIITVSDNGGGDNATLSLLDGAVTFTADDEININSNTAVILNGAGTYVKQLTSTPQLNILTVDTASGQLYYTASSAIGGGGSGTPGGSNTQIQFNGNGAFSGSNALTFNSGSNTLTLTGSLNITGSQTITGLLTVTQNISASSFTGSLLGTATTASYVTASAIVGTVLSASYAQTASYVVTAQTASYVLQAVSASFATLAQTSNTASYVVTAQTASYILNAQTASYILNAVSSSFASTASYVVTAQTASYVTTSQTASYVLQAVSASYASTASYVVTAQTASYVANAQTASYILQAVSASFATLAQTANTASYVVTAQTASYVTASNVIGTVLSASYAVTASYAANIPSLKASSASISSFSGTPRSSSITFASSFPNDSYAVTVTGEDARSWTIQLKTSTGFTINSNSTVALTGPVYWIATPFN